MKILFLALLFFFCRAQAALEPDSLRQKASKTIWEGGGEVGESGVLIEYFPKCNGKLKGNFETPQPCLWVNPSISVVCSVKGIERLYLKPNKQNMAIVDKCVEAFKAFEERRKVREWIL